MADAPNTKLIPLTQGKFALIDADDYERVSVYKWFYHKHPSKKVGYARSNIFASGELGVQVCILMHKFIMGDRGEQIDHKNGDGLDNRKDNLRRCVQFQNMANSRTYILTKVKRSSRFKGVGRKKNDKKWFAQGKHAGKNNYLGSFSDEKDAARAYNAWARQTFGEFALLNDVEE